MFKNAACFNQDIFAWDTLSVTDMSGMFYDAASLNHKTFLHGIHRKIWDIEMD